MSLLPPVAIGSALVAVLLIPVYFLVVSRRPFDLKGVGLRYRLSMLLMVASWLLMVGLFGDLEAAGVWWDMAAGSMILATAALASLNAWSLLCWGYTISMLTGLVRDGGPLTMDGWIENLSDGPIEAFSENRFRLLINMNLVDRREGVVTLRGPKAALIARLDVISQFWHGRKL